MSSIIDIIDKPNTSIIKGSYYLDQPRSPWLVGGMIREGTTVFLSGKEGTGKSFIALELAACIAEGRDFFGNAVRQGAVLYVAAERGDSQRERLEALRDGKGVNPDSIHFYIGQPQFNVEEDERRFIEHVVESGITPKLIIIDTLRASFEGDENSSANAQATMSAFTRIRRVFDATLLVIHHVNGFGKSRGSSAFIGAADTELYLTESKSRRAKKVYLTVRKQNNGRKWLQYTLIPQEFDFGDDYSSIVFNLEETTEVETSPQEEDDNQREAHILSIVEGSSDVLSLNKLQKELQAIEGTLPNKVKLKMHLHKLAKEELIAFDDSEGRFKIASVEN